MDEQEILKKRESIIKTLAFFDIFDFALTREELCDYMLYKKWTLPELNEFSNHEKFLIETHSHVYLQGRPITLQVRKDKEHRARILIKKAKKYAKILRLIPFVRSISICNSLSFYDAEKGSDIDLFIITEKNRLFIARFFILAVTQLLGIRRHGFKISGRFCLSFLISKEEMNIEKIKLHDEDIYFLYWMRLLRPLTGHKTYIEFINANKWVQEYFQYEINQQKHLIKDSFIASFTQKVLEILFISKIGDSIEYLLKKLQLKRSRKKAEKLEKNDGIVISDTMLKFHNVDMRKIYYKLWKKRLAFLNRYFDLKRPDFETPEIERSHQTQILYGSRSQDNVYTKNEEHSHH